MPCFPDEDTVEVWLSVTTYQNNVTMSDCWYQQLQILLLHTNTEFSLMKIYEETSPWLHNMNSPMSRQTNRPLNLYFFYLTWFRLLEFPSRTLATFPKNYAPINVNPVGGECGQGVGIWQILKFFDQIPQGGKRKVNQKCQKSPHPRGKI